MQIKIEVINSTFAPKDGEYTNRLILNYDNWNDYAYKTSFGMYFFDTDSKVHEIGFPKIYFWEHDEERTKSYSTHTKNTLPRMITKLQEEYCSLGNDLSYYENLKQFFPTEYEDILYRLRDIAFCQEIKNEFINEKGVQTSLLRYSGAAKALNEAKALLDEELRTNDISFVYSVMVPYACAAARMRFNFNKSDYIPYRINAIIGKNGTGKTNILSKLANSISGHTSSKKNMFIGKRPLIDKVMSVSYSAFDPFRKPPESDFVDRDFSYVYCGIQSESGNLSLAELRENFKEAYETIIKKKRKEVWLSIMSEIIESTHATIMDIINQGEFNKINWSSGQHILICTITEIIANIENESIILFDEPEIHLHPNAISNTMRMFYRLLEEFNSYAIFSTHSPIILQEIPTKFIQVLEREDNNLIIRAPNVECFGNNISDIITDVFDVNVLESNYKTRLKKLSSQISFDEILDLFNNKLSLNALIYLKSCYIGEEF